MSSYSEPLRAEPYTPAYAAAWDELVTAAANGPFLLRRTFLDYHADRFQDCSWLVWRGGRLRAVFVAGHDRRLPASTQLTAHPGLPYGGLVYPVGLKYAELESIMAELLGAWRAAGYRQLTVRPVPRVFCRQPSEAQAFWLHRQGARLTGRELNSVIDLTQPYRIGSWRRGNLRQARRAGLAVGRASAADYGPYWALLADNLARSHSRQPVHTLVEIETLTARNPGHLELWAAHLEAEVVAGVLVFQDLGQGFAHTQYIAGNARGKQIGAVDAVLARVLAEKRVEYQRLSFGISTVQGVVNAGLLNQKEGFGATAEAQDTYTLDL